MIVAHAPHQLASAETKASYWASVKQCVPTHLRMWPCILLADANAAVGSRTSQHVGAANATPENENGEFLHDVLEHFSLALPATMPDCQWGEHGTWLRPYGTWRRNDYIGIPLCWKDGAQTQAFVEVDLDLSLQKVDHRAVAVTHATASAAKPKERPCF